MAESILTPLPPVKKVTSKKVFKNFSYLTIGTLLAQAFSLITILKITHFLAPAEYGLFTFLIAQGVLLLTISNLGTTNIFIRSIARDPKRTNDLIFNGIILRTAALVILIFSYALYNHYLGSLTLVQIFFIFLLTLASCLYNLAENVFYGNQQMLTPSIVNLTYSLLWFTVVYSLPSDYKNVNSLFCIYFILNTIKAALAIALLKNQGLLIGHINKFWISSKMFLRESWPFFAIIIIMLPVSSLANNFLDLNSTINEVGYFNLSQRLIGPVSLVIGVAFTAIFPNISSLWVDNEQRFYHLVGYGFKYFMLFTLMLCFLFNLFARELVTLLFPDKYLPALQVCKMQVWYLFLTSVDSLIGTILAATNKEKLILRFSLVYFLFCTPIFFYVSQYGAFGLASGYVVSFAICLIYVWHAFKKALKIQIQHSTYVWLLAIVLFTISCFLPSDLSFNYKLCLALPVLTGTAFYFAKSYATIIAR
jgi:O-antigen/teichoic acid export membrane protein